MPSGLEPVVSCLAASAWTGGEALSLSQDGVARGESEARSDAAPDVALQAERRKPSHIPLAPRAARQMSRLACALLACGGTAAAQRDQQIDEFMAVVNEGVTELAERSTVDSAVNCKRVVARAIDIGAVAASALGDASARMSSPQRAAYRAAAFRWAVRDCVRLKGENSGGSFAFAGIRRAQSGALLLATRWGRTPHIVVWRLSGLDRRRAIDVIIDGRSMILALREETTALLNQSDHNIDSAIATLGR